MKTWYFSNDEIVQQDNIQVNGQIILKSIAHHIFMKGLKETC